MKRNIYHILWIASVIAVALLNLLFKDLGIGIFLNAVPLIFITLYIREKGLEIFNFRQPWGIFNFLLFLMSGNMFQKLYNYILVPESTLANSFYAFIFAALYWLSIKFFVLKKDRMRGRS